MKCHSWRCFYRIMRKTIRWGCYQVMRRSSREVVEHCERTELSWCRCFEVEMLRGRDALKFKVSTRRPYEGADAMICIT